MFSKRKSPKPLSQEDNRGTFYASMKQADAEWKSDLLSQDALKDQIIFDSRDGLPRRQLTVNKQVPFLRYAFDTRKLMEKALDSVSFIRKTRRRPGWVSSRSLKVGYYLNRSTRKWEIFLWGPDLDMQVYKECESRFGSNKGNCLTAMPPKKHSATKTLQFTASQDIESVERSSEAQSESRTTLEGYTYRGNGEVMGAVKEALIDQGLGLQTLKTRRSEYRERRMKHQLIDGGARVNELTLRRPEGEGVLKGQYTYMGVKKPVGLKSVLESQWERPGNYTQKSQS